MHTLKLRVNDQIKYISLDSPKRARKFKIDLPDRIREIPVNPSRFRKSGYFDDNAIRDLIFKLNFQLLSLRISLCLRVLVARKCRLHGKTSFPGTVADLLIPWRACSKAGFGTARIRPPLAPPNWGVDSRRYQIGFL
jgi:hypothetical protein